MFAVITISKSPLIAIVDFRAGMGVSWHRQSTSVIKLTVSITVSMLIKNCFCLLRRSFITNSIDVKTTASQLSGLSFAKAGSIVG